jgi:hypothetical protein
VPQALNQDFEMKCIVHSLKKKIGMNFLWHPILHRYPERLIMALASYPPLMARVVDNGIEELPFEGCYFIAGQSLYC